MNFLRIPHRANFVFIFLFPFTLFQCLSYKEHIIDPNSPLSSLLLLSKIGFTLNPFNNSQATINFHPPPGVFQTATKLEMTPSIPNAIIHYTLDGTEPTESSPIYTEPIPIWRIAGRQIQAILIHPDIGQSSPSSPGGYYSMLPLKTGQISCFNSSGSGIFCSGTKHDGDFQKGTSYNYTSPGDGTVIDNVTGLIWEKCTYGHSLPNCSGSPTNETYANANSICSNSTLAGKTWRLPNYYELASLNTTGKLEAIDTTNFTNPPYIEQWTASNRYGVSSDVHTVDFYYSFHQHGNKTNSTNFRCVSGEEWMPVDSFEDLGNGSVKDHRTGLVWQKCSQGLSPPNCTGTISNGDWDTALLDCDNLNSSNFAGRTDWRLPNAHELLSIVRIDQAQQTNPTYFPNTDAAFAYWTSTTHTTFNNQAYSVQFSSGSSLLSSTNKMAGRRVRCVAGP